MVNAVNVDIWGTCISRDVISLGGGDRHINVVNFIQSTNFMVQFSKHVINDAELSETVGTNFTRRTIVYDINKNIVDKLLKSSSQWLIIDARVFSYGVVKYYFDNGLEELFTNINVKEKESVFLNKGLNVVKKENVDYLEIIHLYYSLFIDFVKKKYGKQIIVLEITEAVNYIQQDGLVRSKWYSEEKVDMELDFTNRLLHDLDCYYVKFPYTVIADSFHRWGYSPAHYISEYYKYAYNCVICIIFNNDSRLERQLDLLYSDCLLKASKIRNGEIKTVRNSIERISKFIESGNKDEALNLLNQLIDQKEPEAYKVYSQLYRDGVFVEKNISEAIKWMRLANQNDVPSANYELFELLKSNESKESCKELINLGKLGIKDGDPALIGRFARLYRDGICVEKDIGVAISLFRSASELDITWSNELSDILITSDSEKDRKEAFEICQQLAQKGDSNAMGRLGRMYRDGLFVSVNKTMAAELFRGAASYNRIWRGELFDVLLSLNADSVVEELINLGKLGIKDGDPALIGRFARLYRDGICVEKDIGVAISLFRSASELDITWSNELSDILITSDSEKDRKEAFEICQQLAQKGDSNAMGRLGRMYRDGAGVKKNLDLSIYWYSEASSAGSEWAKDELSLLQYTNKKKKKFRFR